MVSGTTWFVSNIIEKDEAESIEQTRLNLVLQLSWLERYTDNVEVGSSTLPGTTQKNDRWINDK